MKTLLAATAIALLFMSGANASGLSLGGTTNNGGDGGNANAKASASAGAVAVAGSSSAAELNASFLSFMAQGQKQTANTADSTEIAITHTYNERPSGPSIAAGLAALPSFSNAGNMNACAGSEGLTASVGGSVGLSGGQISGSGGLIGFGTSDVVEIEKCEKRESVALLFSLGLKEGALAVACTHKDMAIGVNAQFPGFCAAQAPKPVVQQTASVSPVVASASSSKGTGSNNPDFANLQ